MKKWMIFLLLLITTAGTSIPCCQTDNCCADQSNNTNTEKHKGEGTCPPFFACATCCGFVELANPTHFVQVPVQKQLHYEMFEVLNLSTFSATYWQPPRAC